MLSGSPSKMAVNRGIPPFFGQRRFAFWQLNSSQVPTVALHGWPQIWTRWLRPSRQSSWRTKSKQCRWSSRAPTSDRTTGYQKGLHHQKWIKTCGWWCLKMGQTRKLWPCFFKWWIKGLEWDRGLPYFKTASRQLDPFPSRLEPPSGADVQRLDHPTISV